MIGFDKNTTAAGFPIPNGRLACRMPSHITAVHALKQSPVVGARPAVEDADA
jgi:hypothetical protein